LPQFVAAVVLHALASLISGKGRKCKCCSDQTTDKPTTVSFTVKFDDEYSKGVTFPLEFGFTSITWGFGAPGHG